MTANFTLLAEHIQTALHLDHASREDYLESLPPEIARHVRSLLEFERATLDLSQIPAIELALDVLSEPAPTQVGRWHVRELMGRGGMASVYLVERSEGTIRQLAACKIGYTRAELEDGLRRETATLLDLNHPGIAHVLDFGHTESGRPYMVSERIEGTDIVSYANRQQLPLMARLALFEDVLSAVAHAHERLLLHQDIKPDNILVGTDNRPRLIDFGLASILNSGGDSPVTGYTPRYASPEQRRGERLTIRSDVYSLGVTLAALLEGTSPVRGSDDAQAVIAKATREDQDERYASAAEMVADLRAIRQLRPVTARAGSAGYRLRRFIQRHPLPMALATLVILSIGTGVAATLWQARQAIAASERAETERQRAVATSTFLTDLFASADPSGKGRTETRLGEFLEPAFERLKVDQDLTPHARIDIARALAEAYAGIGEPDQAGHARDYAIELAREIGDTDAEIRVLIDTARAHSAYSGVDAAMQSLDRAVALPYNDPELHHEARYARITIAFANHDWPAVLALAEELARDADGGSPFLAQQRGGLHYSMATALMKLGRLGEAEVAATHAQRHYADRFGERSGPVSNALDIRMQIAMAEGALDRADIHSAELLELAEHVFGSNHLRYGEVLSNIAVLRQHQGRSKDAVEAYLNAYDVLRVVIGEESPRVAVVRQNLGSALVQIGDLEHGLAHLKGADTVLSATLGEDHTMTLKGKGLLAATLGRMGDIEEALAVYELADARFARTAPTSFDRADFLLSYASTLADAGRHAECAAGVTSAQESLEQVVGSDHWFFDLYAAFGAYCQAMLGDEAAANRLNEISERLIGKLPEDSSDLAHVQTLQRKLSAR